jgi:hypothetical protein
MEPAIRLLNRKLEAEQLQASKTKLAKSSWRGNTALSFLVILVYNKHHIKNSSDFDKVLLHTHSKGIYGSHSPI